MTTDDFIRQVPGFGDWSPTEQIKLLAWYIHVHESKDRFSAADIRRCYDGCGMAVPTNISALIHNLVTSKKPLILKDSRGFRLERTLRDKFDVTYGQRAITVAVHKALQELPAKLPNLAERSYLDEALTCFKAGAFRAAIVMCWNVAYDHLCTCVLASRLDDFNARMSSMFPKQKSVAVREDFFEMQERRVLEICRAADIVDKNVYAVLDEKLNIRNRAAHASGSTFLQPQAEGYILDLLNNAVLKL